ncbi:MAG TPA: feruloyl-CoA synthase, partial [Pusillimonas sp.]|nr:feruloyl-CoA synthase [Pusillimonas sp.]
DGFFRSGDAASLADKNNPSKGIVFEGRINEDFKLHSGTWVSVGRLRGLLMGELLPLVSDVVIAGQGRDRLGLLVF